MEKAYRTERPFQLPPPPPASTFQKKWEGEISMLRERKKNPSKSKAGLGVLTSSSGISASKGIEGKSYS